MADDSASYLDANMSCLSTWLAARPCHSRALLPLIDQLEDQYNAIVPSHPPVLMSVATNTTFLVSSVFLSKPSPLCRRTTSFLSCPEISHLSNCVETSTTTSLLVPIGTLQCRYVYSIQPSSAIVHRNQWLRSISMPTNNLT
jgi:hypothetical protein